MESSDDKVGYADEILAFSNEREGGDVFFRTGVMGLVVEDYPRFMRRRWYLGRGWHRESRDVGRGPLSGLLIR